MKNTINLCFDLDGPIVNVIDRYYRAYLESLKGISVSREKIIEKEEFWKLKQNRVSDFEMGILSGLGISESQESANLRKDLTFKPEYFSMDKLFEDVYETFDYLKEKNITFFIVTLRRRSHLMQAIKQFKLNNYLTSEKLFSIDEEQKVSNDIKEKYILLVNAVNNLNLNPAQTWLVGDSDTDIHAGRLAKYRKVIAITRGIKSKEQLEILKPDYLIDGLREIANLLPLPSANFK